MKVYVVLFHPPAELDGKSRVVVVADDPMIAAMYANAKIEMAVSEIAEKCANDTRPGFRELYRLDYTEDEMRAWVDVVEKELPGVEPCRCPEEDAGCGGCLCGCGVEDCAGDSEDGDED